jgi:hemoglobin/transferrin/lactoferrin receptor protein
MVGTLNTGFRAPNVDDMSKFGTIEANIFEIPSGLLSPERSLNMETGLKYNSSKLSWNVTAYQSRLTDLIDRVATSYNGSPTFEGRTVYQKRNVGEAIIKGMEADVDAVVIKSLTVYGNITYTYGENKTRKEPMRRIPPLFGRLGLRYGHPSGLWIRTELAVAGKQDRLAGGDRSDARINIRLIDGVMPGWDIVNLHAGYSYRFLSIQLSAQNIFDEAYRVYASGIDSYGRSMTAAVNIRF